MWKHCPGIDGIRIESTVESWSLSRSANDNLAGLYDICFDVTDKTGHESPNHTHSHIHTSLGIALKLDVFAGLFHDEL